MSGPACAASLLWKVGGLHVQSEDKRVFVCVEPSIFSQYLFVVFLASEIGEIGKPGSWTIVGAGEQSAPLSKRRQATGTGTIGLRKKLVNVAKKILQLTSSFVCKFWRRNLSESVTFAVWHRSARRSREQHGHLGMCFFASGERVLPSWSWMWTSRRLAYESRLIPSQVVDSVGWVKTPTPLAAGFMRYRLTIAGGSILGLLQKRSTEHTTIAVWQKIRSVPHFLQPPATIKTLSQTQKCFKWRDEISMARAWKHIFVTRISARKYRYGGVFFLERSFQPLSVGGIFSNQRESISRCPKSPLPSKTENQQSAQTSPPSARERSNALVSF